MEENDADTGKEKQNQVDISYRPGPGVFGLSQTPKPLSTSEDAADTDADEDKMKGPFERMLEDEERRRKAEEEKFQYLLAGHPDITGSILYDYDEQTSQSPTLATVPGENEQPVSEGNPKVTCGCSISASDGTQINTALKSELTDQDPEDNEVNTSFMEGVSSGSSLDMDTGSGAELGTETIEASELPTDEEVQGLRTCSEGSDTGTYSEESTSAVPMSEVQCPLSEDTIREHDSVEVISSPTISEKVKKQNFLKRLFTKEKKH